MKKILILLFYLALATSLMAQDKPKPIKVPETVTLSKDSVQVRINQLNDAILERTKLIERYQDEIKTFVGIRTGLMIALNDTTLTNRKAGK
jgi:hypothetical protein